MKTYKPVQFKSSVGIISERSPSSQRVATSSVAATTQPALQRHASWDAPGTAAQTSNGSLIAQKQQQSPSGGAREGAVQLTNSHTHPAGFTSPTSVSTGTHHPASVGGITSLPRSFSLEHSSSSSSSSKPANSPSVSSAAAPHKSVKFTNQTVVHSADKHADVRGGVGGGEQEADVGAAHASSARWTPTLTSSAKININTHKRKCEHNVKADW